MHFDTLLDLARKYEGLGTSIQRQLDALMEGAPVDEQNPNAVALIQSFLRQVQRTAARDELLCADVEDLLSSIRKQQRAIRT